MKTSAWSIYRGPGRVGICLGAPRRAPAGFRLYRTLAPTRPMLDMPLARYEPLYREILAGLDPRAIWDRLHELAGGAEPVLMCFETPPFTLENFCHRRLVAAWFEQELGEVVDELEAQPAFI